MGRVSAMVVRKVFLVETTFKQAERREAGLDPWGTLDSAVSVRLGAGRRPHHTHATCGGGSLWTGALRIQGQTHGA